MTLSLLSLVVWFHIQMIHSFHLSFLNRRFISSFFMSSFISELLSDIIDESFLSSFPFYHRTWTNPSCIILHVVLLHIVLLHHTTIVRFHVWSFCPEQAIVTMLSVAIESAEFFSYFLLVIQKIDRDAKAIKISNGKEYYQSDEGCRNFFQGSCGAWVACENVVNQLVGRD